MVVSKPPGIHPNLNGGSAGGGPSKQEQPVTTKFYRTKTSYNTEHAHARSVLRLPISKSEGNMIQVRRKYSFEFQPMRL